MAGQVGAIPLVDAAGAPLLARRYYADGDPGPIVAALAHVPELLEAALPFISTVLGPSSIDARRKELVILRTSGRAGCRFCVAAHSVAALDAGLSVTEVRALRGEAPLEAFPDHAERALLRWVDVVAQPGPVDAGRRAELCRRFPVHELVELTLLVGATLMLNRFCSAFELPSDPATLARLREAGLR